MAKQYRARVTDILIIKIRKLWKQGFSITQISNILNVAHTTASRYKGYRKPEKYHTRSL